MIWMWSSVTSANGKTKMNCSICHKPILLSPSASERAKNFGGKPSYYTKLFTTHSDCFIENREADTRELIRKINSELY